MWGKDKCIEDVGRRVCMKGNTRKTGAQIRL
jgi:hypothetical protein